MRLKVARFYPGVTDCRKTNTQLYYGSRNFSDAVFTSTDIGEALVNFTTGPDNTTAMVYYYVQALRATAFGDDFELAAASD